MNTESNIPSLTVPRVVSGASEETIRECQGILERHARSFSAAAVFLSPEMRRDAAICYAFCRLVDDAVDEEQDPRSAAREVTRIESMLDGTIERDPIVAAYVELSERLGFGLLPAQDLLAGARSDLAQVRVKSDVEFLEYCYRVAGTVGLMMCGVLGVTDPAARKNAVSLGMAMQMTNICRDVLEDAERDRVYLPETRLSGVGLSHGDVLCAAFDASTGSIPRGVRAGVSEVVRGLLSWAESYYASGAKGFPFIPPRPRLAIMVASSLYSEIGETLRARGCDPFLGRARVSSLKKIFLTVRTALNWFMGAGHRPFARLQLPARVSPK